MKRVLFSAEVSKVLYGDPSGRTDTVNNNNNNIWLGDLRKKISNVVRRFGGARQE